jgi:hypothetical protein
VRFTADGVLKDNVLQGHGSTMPLLRLHKKGEPIR